MQVLCSVPDVDRVLSEVSRVLKPGGSLLFIEHTSAEAVRGGAGMGLLRKFQGNALSGEDRTAPRSTAAPGSAAACCSPSLASSGARHPPLPPAAQGRQPLLWLGQRALEPLQRLLADNCHLTRDPLPAIQERFAAGGGVEARRFSVEGASLIAPHVAGIARRAGAA